MLDPKTRHYIRAGISLGTGIMVIILVIFLLQGLLGYIQVMNAPSGWQIIRPPGEVHTLMIDNDTVWTGGKDGVILIDRISRQQKTLPRDPPSFGYVRQIFLDHAGTIWIGHDGGLVQFRNNSWVISAPAYDVPFKKALSIAELHDGSIVIGTDLNVFISRGTGWTGMFGPDDPSIASADTMLVDWDGNLWVGSSDPTRGALYRFDGSAWKEYTIADGLPHHSISSISLDHNGTVWAAAGFTRDGGAAWFQDGSWHTLTDKDALPGVSIRTIYQDLDGRMWICSEYNGVALNGNTTWRILTDKDGLAGSEVKVMKQDKDGTYWLGTDRGLSVIRNATLV